MKLNRTKFNEFIEMANSILSVSEIIRVEKYEQFLNGVLPDLSNEIIRLRGNYPFGEFSTEFNQLSTEVVDEIQVNLIGLSDVGQVEGYLDLLDPEIVAQLVSFDKGTYSKSLHEGVMKKKSIDRKSLSHIQEEHLELLECFYHYYADCYRQLRRVKTEMDYRRKQRGVRNSGLQHSGTLSIQTGIVSRKPPVYLIEIDKIFQLYKSFYNELFTEISVGDFLACFDVANTPKNIPCYPTQDHFVAMLSQISKKTGAKRNIDNELALQNFGIKNYKQLKSKLSSTAIHARILRKTSIILNPKVLMN